MQSSRLFLVMIDDLPRRDDNGERRRKHDQLRVLAVTGSKTEVDAAGMRTDDR
jgi:hypothetical protein